MKYINKEAFIGLDILKEDIKDLTAFKMLTKIEQQSINEKCFDLVKEQNLTIQSSFLPKLARSLLHSF